MRVYAFLLFVAASYAIADPTLYTVEGDLETGLTITPYVEPTEPEEPVEPVEYDFTSIRGCASYVPYENGYSFTDQDWERACDTNGDVVYVLCDDYVPTGVPTFDELDYRRACTNKGAALF